MARTTRQASVDDSRPASANYHANALARGLALLEMLAAGPEPLTLGEFSDRTALPKGTLVRLLSVLAEMHYVVRVNERPAYRLDPKVSAAWARPDDGHRALAGVGPGTAPSTIEWLVDGDPRAALGVRP